MNRERYRDTTAELAIGRVTREEKLQAQIRRFLYKNGYELVQIKIKRKE